MTERTAQRLEDVLTWFADLFRWRPSGLWVWLWNRLPSRCEICRGGTRGNENRQPDSSGKGWVLCDYCTSARSRLRRLEDNQWLRSRPENEAS